MFRGGGCLPRPRLKPTASGVSCRYGSSTWLKAPSAPRFLASAVSTSGLRAETPGSVGGGAEGLPRRNAKQLMAGLLRRARRGKADCYPSCVQNVLSVLRYAESHFQEFDAIHSVTALQGIASSVSQVVRLDPRQTSGKGASLASVWLSFCDSFARERCGSRLEETDFNSEWRVVSFPRIQLPSSQAALEGTHSSGAIFLPSRLHPVLRCLYTDATFLALRAKLLIALESSFPLPASHELNDSLSRRTLSVSLWTLGNLRVCDAELLLCLCDALCCSLLRSRGQAGVSSGADISLSAWGLVAAGRFADSALVLRRNEESGEEVVLEERAARTRREIHLTVKKTLRELVHFCTQERNSVSHETRGIAALLWAIAKAGVYVHPGAAAERRRLESALVQRQQANLSFPLQLAVTDSSLPSARRGEEDDGRAEVFMQFFESSLRSLQKASWRGGELENRHLASCLWATAVTLHPAAQFVDFAGEALLKRTIQSSPSSRDQPICRDVVDALASASQMNCFPSSLFQDLPRTLLLRRKDEASRWLEIAPLRSLSSCCWAFQRFAESADPGILARLQLARFMRGAGQRGALLRTAKTARKLIIDALWEARRRTLASGARGVSWRETPGTGRKCSFRRGVLRSVWEKGQKGLSLAGKADQAALEAGAEATVRKKMQVAHGVWRAVASEISERFLSSGLWEARTFSEVRKEGKQLFSLIDLCAAVRCLAATDNLNEQLFLKLRSAALKVVGLVPDKKQLLAAKDTFPERRIEGFGAEARQGRRKPFNHGRDTGSKISLRGRNFETLARHSVRRVKTEPLALLETRDFLVVYKPPFWIANTASSGETSEGTFFSRATEAEVDAWVSRNGSSKEVSTMAAAKVEERRDKLKTEPLRKSDVSCSKQKKLTGSDALLNSGSTEPLQFFLQQRVLEGDSQLLRRRQSPRSFRSRSGRVGVRRGSWRESRAEFGNVAFDSKGASCGMTHRLDAETSGPLLVAKTSLGFHSARFDFDAQRPRKSYLFLCHGRLSPRDLTDRAICSARSGSLIRVFKAVEGFWLVSGPLLTFKEATRQSLFTALHGDGRRRNCDCHLRSQHAATLIRPLFYFSRQGREFTLCAADLLTGRTHQIRVHMQALGHPLVMDSKYQTDSEAFASDTFWCSRLFLHGIQLRFEGARDKRRSFRIVCPLPSDLKASLSHLEFQGAC